MPARENENHHPVSDSPALALDHIRKAFPGVVAVDDVSVTLGGGQITALLGQNGAGKSTLIGVMAGLYGRDFDGAVTVGGEPFAPETVAAAEQAGIVLIAQEINVVPEFSVAEMLMLNREPTRFGLIDHDLLVHQATMILREFGVEVAATDRMGDLDLARQQLVMIARALSANARVLILDEPTAALTANEADRLFERLRSYRDRGTSCLFVSHRLAEVFALVDRILVMRNGQLVGDHMTSSTSRDEIVAEMLGDERGLDAVPVPGNRPAARKTRLRVKNFTVFDPGQSGRRVVDSANLAVAEGEIVGLFGLIGSGAGPLSAAIFGGWKGKVTGVIEVDGQPVEISSPEDAVRNGIGFIAQDRRDALVADQSVASNIVLASLPRFSARQFFDHASARAEANLRVSQLEISTRSNQTMVRQLSGGNQQKVQVARWLTAATPILILDDPNRGVDVGAGAEILRILRELANDGRSLLLVSSEARELLEVCDRILIIVGGRITAELDPATATESDLVSAAAEVGDGEAA